MTNHDSTRKMADTLGKIGSECECECETAGEAGGEVIDFNLKRAKLIFEQKLIKKALARTSGNKTKAAKLLGITREGLRKALLKTVA